MMDIPPYIFADAVRTFWHGRQQQSQRQQARGTTDQGARGEVTGGQHMHGFARVLREYAEKAGVPASSIHTTADAKSQTELPGYFRPTKSWDVVVVHQRNLIAAIELKSQVGPSFSNNFNNRIEEALGSVAEESI
jgi:hypothetical protein